MISIHKYSTHSLNKFLANKTIYCPCTKNHTILSQEHLGRSSPTFHQLRCEVISPEITWDLFNAPKNAARKSGMNQSLIMKPQPGHPIISFPSFPSRIFKPINHAFITIDHQPLDHHLHPSRTLGGSSTFSSSESESAVLATGAVWWRRSSCCSTTAVAPEGFGRGQVEKTVGDGAVKGGSVTDEITTILKQNRYLDGATYYNMQ